MSIDNWGSVAMFFWIDYKYPVLTTSSNFMQLKTDSLIKSAANIQALVGFSLCSVSLISVSISGMTFIDFCFDKLNKDKIFHLVILGCIAAWFIFSYMVTKCYFSCFKTEEKEQTGDEKPNTTINEGGDSEKGE